ncbi:MAG: hypothetical protein SVR94_08620 [Pseudomonadota bacterium]|nr:hypothetical protein [Pseudomonadota bacterium]
MPQRDPMAQNLLDEINTYIKKEKVLSEFEQQRFEREAKKLMRAGFIKESYEMRGKIAFLVSDMQNMRKHFETAISYAQAGQAQQNAKTDYAIALFNSGFFWEAADKINEVYQAKPLNEKKLLELNIKYHFFAGSFLRARALLAVFHEKYPDEKHSLAEDIKAAAALMEERNISDEQVENLVRVSMSVLHDREDFSPAYLAYEQKRMYMLEDESSKWFQYGIELTHLAEDEPSSLKKLVDLNLELDDRLVKSNLAYEVSNNFIPLFRLV